MVAKGGKFNPRKRGSTNSTTFQNGDWFLFFWLKKYGFLGLEFLFWDHGSHQAGKYVMLVHWIGRKYFGGIKYMNSF